jgi:predicted kinase
MGKPIVNPDAIRLALHGQRFLEEAEPMVWSIAMYMAKSLFLAGHNEVIVDATNTTRKRRDFWKHDLWARKFVHIDASKEACLEIAKQANDTEIMPVIESMAKQFTSVTSDELWLNESYETVKPWWART